jgi:DNA-binding NtrC family response regulator
MGSANISTLEPGPVLVFRDPRMRDIVELAQHIAPFKAAVLITGETGSGKEVIARLIHQHSARSSRPWVDVNCAALPEHLVESELFGYEKGAFSGADSAKAGLFEIANNGTLFLDEIGELEPRIQVKLLRALDGVPYYRLGSNKKVSVDVRVVAATNRDLQKELENGSFRSDLYHRLDEVQISVPPLRERPEDIPLLAQHFLVQARPDATLTASALAALQQHDWPGNVRELRNVVVKLAMLSRHSELTADDVNCQVGGGARFDRRHCMTSEAVGSLDEMERQMIVRALEKFDGNQTLAAEQLGISRRTLCRKLNEYQVSIRRRSLPVPGFLLDPQFRADLNVPITISAGDGRSCAATARNVSLGGLGLQGFRPPSDFPHELSLRFMLPATKHQIEVKGVLVWSNPDATAGVRFAELAHGVSEQLRRWIAKRAFSGYPSLATAPLPVAVSHC